MSTTMNEKMEVERARTALVALAQGETIKVLGRALRIDSDGKLSNVNIATGHEFSGGAMGFNALMICLGKIDDETYARFQAMQSRSLSQL